MRKKRLDSIDILFAIYILQEQQTSVQTCKKQQTKFMWFTLHEYGQQWHHMNIRETFEVGVMTIMDPHLSHDQKASLAINVSAW